MRKSIIQPNYDIMLKSSISALKILYGEYKKAVNESIRWTGYDDNGDFFVLSGQEERARKVTELEAQIIELKKHIDGMKQMRKERGE